MNVLNELGFFDFPNLILTKDVTLGNFFAPTIAFGRIPVETTFAADIVHYALQRKPGAGRNFGHTVWKELGSIFHALQTFDLPREDGRLVLLTDHTQPKTFPPFFPRVSAYIDEFPNGTCFRRMVMGFAGVGSFEQGFSLYRSAHAVEFRKFYLKMLNVTHLTKTTRHRAPIIVNMYPKVVIGNGHVWSGVCKLANELSFVFSKLEFRCVSLHEMSLEVQAQVISQATIHVWPNGKPVAYSHECERFTNQSFGRWIGVRANLCGRRILGNLTRARLCQRNKCAEFHPLGNSVLLAQS